jgi:hypothetical protein
MTIRDRGKEWVTSGRDKRGCSGRSRRKMQTAIAPRTLPGPQMSGTTPPRIAAEGDPGQDDPAPNAVDAFASVMLEKPDERDIADADTPSLLVEAEPALPPVAFWPALALQLGAASTVAAAPGQTATSETPLTGNVKLAEAAAFVVLPSTEGGAEGAAPVPSTAPPSAQSAVVAFAPGVLGLPAGMMADEASPPNSAPTLAGQMPDLAAAPTPGPVSGPVAETLPALDGLTRPPAGLPLTAFAATAQRFSQAAPQSDAPTSSELLGDEDGAPALGDNAKTDKLAPLTAAPASTTPATAAPAVLVAKLAETALQSLFAAQAEAAARDTGDAEGLGLSPLGVHPATHAASVAAAPPTAVPSLAAQLVQTLAQRPDGTTEIALSPDELGHVRVTLQADAKDPDRIVVMLNFERPETLDLFRRHADQLADALRSAGFSGADIGFGRSDGGENRNAQPEAPLPDTIVADRGPVDPVNGNRLHQPTLRLAANSTLDLRL